MRNKLERVKLFKNRIMYIKESLWKCNLKLKLPYVFFLYVYVYNKYNTCQLQEKAFEVQTTCWR